MHPLFIYVGKDYYGCTSDYREIPFHSASQVVHTTKERVEYFLESPWEIKKAYPEIFKLVEEKYKKKILHILEIKLFDLPDVNGSECNIDD